MSRSANEQKVNQGHRKSYARMKKYMRHRSRAALNLGLTRKEAKLKQHAQ